MERLSFSNKRILFVFAALLLTDLAVRYIPVRGFVPHNMSAVIYCILIMLWGITVRLRIPDRKVQLRISAACIFMVFLFVLRMCKFSFFPEHDGVNQMLWYMYYIPMTAIPLCVFLTGLCVEPSLDPGRMRSVEKVLIVVEVFLCVAVLTNSHHEQVFGIIVPPEKEITHEWFYYILVLWMAGLGIGTVVILLRKCSISAAKALWYIPVIFIAAGLVLLAVYLVNGGPPKLFGHKLYQMQEAYCLPYITAVESLIQIGLINANTGYKFLFEHSGIDARIDAYEDEKTAGPDTGEVPEEEENKDRRIRRKPVSGGTLTWVEDLSEINRLNRELEEVTEELEDENDLIRKENETRALRVGYETKNRLYNRIAAAVRKEAVKADDILKTTDPEKKGFRDDLVYCAFLSAYIKRMGNLMLLTDEKKELSSGELKLALSESIDCIGLGERFADLKVKGERIVPAGLMILAYDLFEETLESSWREFRSAAVFLDLNDGFSMRLEVDARADSIGEDWKAEKVRDAGAELSVRYEDDTFCALLRKKEAVS